MSRRGNITISAYKCIKCGNNQTKHEYPAMHSRYGIFGRNYKFDVYICQDYGYSELFYRGRTPWV